MNFRKSSGPVLRTDRKNRLHRMLQAGQSWRSILLPVLTSPYPDSRQCRSAAEMPHWRRSTSNIQPYRSQPHNSARRRLLRFRIFRMARRPQHFRSRSHERNRTCQIKLRPWHKRQRKTDRPDIFHIHSMGGFHRNTSCRRLSSRRFNPADSCRQTDRQRRAQNDDSCNRSKPRPCRRPPHRTIFQSAVNLLSYSGHPQMTRTLLLLQLCSRCTFEKV